MASTYIGSQIFVLTDTPGTYGDELNHDGRGPIFVKTIESLLDQLRNVSVAGLVLELSKVMKATRQERDRLFNYAGSFPVLRTKINPRHGFVTYLDERACFFSNLDAAIGKRCRSHERIQVEIPCTLSSEDDPSMAHAIDGTIRDISPGGCFINTPTPPEGDHFIHLRIPQTGSSRPIYSSVRWTKKDSVAPDHCGLGVMFIDLTDGQLDSIHALQLRPLESI